MFTAYRIAFGFLKENFTFFAAFVCLIWLGGILVEFLDVSTSVLFVAYGVIAYGFHRALLFGEVSAVKAPETPARPVAMGRFIWVFAVLFIPIVATTIMTLLFWNKISNAGFTQDSAIIVALIVAALVNLVLLTLFGMALPAAAAADRYGFGITLRRAKKTWAKVLFGMIAGPGTFWIVYLGGAIWFSATVYEIGPTYAPSTGFDIGQILLALGLAFCTIFATLLSVTVLCRAYRNVAPKDIQDVMIGAVSKG